MKFTAVIFDLFGTLVDDFVSSVGQMPIELAAALEVPREPFMEHWRRTSGMRTDGTFQTVEASLEHVCNAIGARAGAKQLTKAVNLRLDQIGRALAPKPDAITTLERLKDARYRIGLLSNCSIEIPILWPKTPFAPLIDAAVFSSRERLKKPDPRIFQLACERLSVTPESCLYVADGENYELTAAAKLGLHPVLIKNPKSQSRPSLFKEAEEWQGEVITALAEVMRFSRIV
jgi:putative hydrolase of the HAD superfamily